MASRLRSDESTTNHMATIEARQSRRNRLSKCLATKLYAAKKLATFCFRIAFRYMDAVLNFAHVTRFGLRRLDGWPMMRGKRAWKKRHASGCKTLARASLCAVIAQVPIVVGTDRRTAFSARVRSKKAPYHRLHSCCCTLTETRIDCTLTHTLADNDAELAPARRSAHCSTRTSSTAPRAVAPRAYAELPRRDRGVGALQQ